MPSTYTDKRREYYNNNKTKILEKQKKYDSEHMKQIRESRKQSQYTCSCGSIIQKSNLPQHNKSKKHLKYKMENEKPDFWDQFTYQFLPLFLLHLILEFEYF